MITERDIAEMHSAGGDEMVALIMERMGQATRVLALDGTPELLTAIRAAGGQVVLVDHHGHAGCDTALCERVIACQADEADLQRALGADRFDAIVAMVPEGWANPMTLLQALPHYLHLGGRLIVAWRNPAHLGLRLALLHGRFGLEGRPAPDGLPRRLYTLREVEHLLAEAGYTVASLDRQTVAWGRERIAEVYPTLSPELQQALAQDPEAETMRFIATLQPRQWATPEYLAGRLQETNRRQDALAATVTELRRDLDERTDRLHILEAALAQAEQRGHVLQEQLAMERASAERTLDQLRLIQDGQAQRLDALAAQVELASGRVGELRTLVLGGAGNGASPEGAMQSALGALLTARRDPLPPAARSDPHRYRIYQQVIHRIRGIVRSAIPDGATVIVISRGDEELLRLDGKQGWHFPQLAHGVYAGFYPADSAAVIAHLEDLRAAGGDFLLIPATALWWLDHYVEFRLHLESRYRVVSRQPDTCMIFALNTVEPGA